MKRTTTTHHPRPLTAALLAAGLCAGLAACSVSGGDDADSGGDASADGSGGAAGGTVVLATHDSWALPERLVTQFERDTGLELEIVPSGDAGELTNKLVLTRGQPIADAVFGVDNTFGSRALEEGVLVDGTADSGVTADGPSTAADYALPGDDGGALAPVDWGDVCVNVDLAWFRERGEEPPATLEDLTDPAYRDLFSTPSAASSSPGFAFLLATVGAFGEDGWQDYWRDLLDNGARVAGSWTDAYEGDFTASGQGDRPVVLSYSSSPPFTIPEGGDEPTTAALPDTCFRQVEYAGVLEGADNPEGAEQVVRWLQSRPVQEALPSSMYVYPVDGEAALPPQWERFAPAADEPFTVDPATVDERRDDWIREWTDLISG